MPDTSFLYTFPRKKYKIQNKIGTIHLSLISKKKIFVFIILSLGNYEKLYETKQTIFFINYITKFLKYSEIFQLMSFSCINDITWGVGLGCENESIEQGRSYSQMNINISYCFFSRYLSFSEEGGVIYVNGGSYSMNVNYSMFYNCVCSSHGGAIYFSSTNSSLRMICAYRCSCGASNSYHFAYLQASQINHVEYLSLSNCSHITSRHYPIFIKSGNQRVDNTNGSMNNAQTTSGFYIQSPSSFTSSHCTFSNNKVSEYKCINFDSALGTILMSYANIVHNNSPNDYGVVFVSGAGSKKMMYCIFRNNQNTLFCVWSGSLEVSHSFISHSASFSTSTSVSKSNNNSFTIRNTYQLQFFN